jgi:hypothetical protein
LLEALLDILTRFSKLSNIKDRQLQAFITTTSTNIIVDLLSIEGEESVQLQSEQEVAIARQALLSYNRYKEK